LWQKRPICIAKEAYLYVFVENESLNNQGVLYAQPERVKRGLFCGKRGLFVLQKRPICIAKETYLKIIKASYTLNPNASLNPKQRPNNQGILNPKESPNHQDDVLFRQYLYGKRSLFVWQKRPIRGQ
jgi:hypothetical protein